MQTDIYFWSYLAHFFLEWEMFQTKVVEKIKTHILCSVTFFKKSYRLWDNVEKYGTAGQTAVDNMAYALCVLVISGYKHTLTICNIHCFPTTTMVARARFIVIYTTLPVLLTQTSNSTIYIKALLLFHCQIVTRTDCNVRFYVLCLSSSIITYLFTYLPTYLLTYSLHGAESFLSS